MRRGQLSSRLRTHLSAGLRQVLRHAANVRTVAAPCAPCTGLAENGRFNVKVRCLPDKLDWQIPLESQGISSSQTWPNLFHGSVPDGYIARAWDVMGRTPQAHLPDLHQAARPPAVVAADQVLADKAGDSSSDAR